MEVRHESRYSINYWKLLGRRYRVLLGFFAFVFLLPMLLSPTRPIAVYGYLFDTFVFPKVFSARVDSRASLTGFLTSPALVERFRIELREDMTDTRSGHLFAIAKCPDGTFSYRPIRTWNSFLPANLPLGLSVLLDRKELPYLADTVEIWLDGFTIEAIGHYHPFGGGPSPGDRWAERFSTVPEVVVSNGVVPTVYLQGDIVAYGTDVEISTELFRSIRALEKSLLMEINYVAPDMVNPSEAIRSFLAFLRDYRGIDSSKKYDVAKELYKLCQEFREDYRSAFGKGYIPFEYVNDLDRHTLLWNLVTVEMWSASILDEFETRPGTMGVLRPTAS